MGPVSRIILDHESQFVDIVIRSLLNRVKKSLN